MAKRPLPEIRNSKTHTLRFRSPQWTIAVDKRLSALFLIIGEERRKCTASIGGEESRTKASGYKVEQRRLRGPKVEHGRNSGHETAGVRHEAVVEKGLRETCMRSRVRGR